MVFFCTVLVPTPCRKGAAEFGVYCRILIIVKIIYNKNIEKLISIVFCKTINLLKG